MIVVLFRSRPTTTVDARMYGELGRRLSEVVAAMPGFVSLDVFEGANDATLIVARFDSPEAEAAWRDHPDHVAARARRADFYVEYDVQVCTVVREYAWKGEGGAP